MNTMILAVLRRSASALICGVGSLLAVTVVAAPQCRPLAHDGKHFTVCTARADQDEIRLWHSDSEGNLYGDFDAVDAGLRHHDKRLSFAMNGGMYHEDRRPVGLYLEDGKQLGPLVTRAGPGNFGLLPNGIFCVREDNAQVIESRTYAAARPACRYASQSGPMLVIDGQLHPRFLATSNSVRIRNGVGVEADGATVHFAISDDPVNFHAFGRLFRDALKTPNALYLDGNVSRLYAPSLGRSDFGVLLGPIVGATVPLD